MPTHLPEIQDVHRFDIVENMRDKLGREASKVAGLATLVMLRSTGHRRKESEGVKVM